MDERERESSRRLDVNKGPFDVETSDRWIVSTNAAVSFDLSRGIQLRERLKERGV
jgi:hypothetical protein